MVSATLVLPFLFAGSYAQGLHTLAKAAGLEYFGTATDNPELTDAPYVAMLENSTQWGAITPGNSMKWDTVEPTQGTFVYTKGDVIADIASKNSMHLRCHTTVWYSQLPSWVSGGTWTNATLIAVMQNHIKEEVTHYKGQCYHWDVVNEAFSDTNGAFRDSVFFKTIGEQYIQIAFEAARAADPTAKLFYNDYNIEYSGAKATSALAMVTKLVNNGAPIDGVGFQGHYIVGKMPSSADLIKTFGTYTALGLEVAITELDIRITLPSTATSLAQQSTDYQTAVNACLSVAKCVGVTVWDFTDKYSWIPSVFSGQGEACLYDDKLVAKPAYAGVVSALKGSTRTKNALVSTGAPAATSAAVVASPAVSSTAAPTTLQTIVKPSSSAVPVKSSSSAAPVKSSSSAAPAKTSASTAPAKTSVASPVETSAAPTEAPSAPPPTEPLATTTAAAGDDETCD